VIVAAGRKKEKPRVPPKKRGGFTPNSTQRGGRYGHCIGKKGPCVYGGKKMHGTISSHPRASATPLKNEGRKKRGKRERDGLGEEGGGI